MFDLYRDRPYARERFRRIVNVARQTNAFYARWIVDPENVPILDRRTFQRHNDEILNGHPETGGTSGSTGMPVRFSQSSEWLGLARQDTERFVALLGGRLPALRIIYTDDKEQTPDLLSVKTRVDNQIETILRRRRESDLQAITTYPSNAALLCERVLERELDMRFVRRFGLYSEVVEPFHRRLVAEAFPNARIWTTYSSSEFGMIAAECPFEPGFHHIMAHRLGVELLRDDDSPADYGERGRMVVTDYVNRRSPFIRYELGDYAVRGRCPCGRLRLPALSAIYGKVRGALLHRNGNRIVFTDLSVSLRTMSGMRQYQVVQTGVEEFVVKVAARRNLDAEIREAFEKHFGYVPERLRIEYVESIASGPNGKFHASICTV